MKITADTNLLVRGASGDDPRQARSAAQALQTAESIAIPIPALCEFAWVMRRGYKRPAEEIAQSIRALLDAPNVVTNQPAAEAGLAVLEKGGDFADGAIAYEGNWLGGEEFVSFDRKAVALVKALGIHTRLLS